MEFFVLVFPKLTIPKCGINNYEYVLIFNTQFRILLIRLFRFIFSKLVAVTFEINKLEVLHIFDPQVISILLI